MLAPRPTEEFLEQVLTEFLESHPHHDPTENDIKQVSSILKLLGKKHTTAILAQISTEETPSRFTTLEDAVDIAPNTLARRLEELTELGLLSRIAYDEIPPRVEYVETEKAIELAPIFWYLIMWYHRHDLGRKFNCDENSQTDKFVKNAINDF